MNWATLSSSLEASRECLQADPSRIKSEAYKVVALVANNRLESSEDFAGLFGLAVQLEVAQVASKHTASDFMRNLSYSIKKAKSYARRSGTGV